MKILQLHIEEFGGIKDRALTFGEGFNIIEGENESGKSTIWLFIKFMLYGVTRKKKEDYLRSVSRGGHCAKGSMTVSFEGETYRVERTYTEGLRSGSERLNIYRLRDGEEVFAGMQPGEVFLRVPREVYESSCGVGQMKCDGVSDSKSADAIRNLLSSGDETADITKIQEKLKKIRISYRHMKGQGGKLNSLSEQIAAEKSKLDRSVANHQRAQALEARMERIQKQLSEVEAEEQRVHTLLTQMGSLSILRRFEKLRENEALLGSLEKQQQALQSQTLKTEYLPTETDVATLRAQAAALTQAEERLVEAKRRREALKPLTESEEKDAAMGERLEADGGFESVMGRLQALKKKGILALGMMIACLVIGLLFVVQSAYPWLRIASVAPWLLAGMGIAMMIGNRVKIQNIVGAYETSLAEFPLLSRCVDALARKRAYAEDLVRADTQIAFACEAADPLKESLRQTICRTLPTDESPTSALALTEAARLETFLRAFTDLESRQNAVRLWLDGERRALSEYDEETLRAQIPESLHTATEADLKRAQTEQVFFAEKRRALGIDRNQTQIELVNLRAESASPMEISDRVTALTEAQERAEDYYESLVMAMEALQAASDAMSGSVTPRLSKDAGSMMAYISDGRYAELQTGQELSPSLWDASGAPMSTDMMSGGTRDAAYLSLRIALMMQIFEGELPPLILDESLCSMDDRRMARMLAFLGKLSETRLQCLLFTCHTRESAACEASGIPFCKIRL